MYDLGQSVLFTTFRFIKVKQLSCKSLQVKSLLLYICDNKSEKFVMVLPINGIMHLLLRLTNLLEYILEKKLLPEYHICIGIQMQR